MGEQARHSIVIGDNIPLSFVTYDFELETCFQPNFEPEIGAEVWLSSGTSSNGLKLVVWDGAKIIDQLNDFHPIY